MWHCRAFAGVAHSVPLIGRNRVHFWIASNAHPLVRLSAAFHSNFSLRKNFDMSLEQLRASPIHLILDWDGTLTKKDTLHFLGKICAEHRKKGSQGASSQSQETQDPWDEIVQKYLDDYSAHEKAYRPEKSKRKTTEQEAAWLGSLQPIENRSVKRVEDYGIFKGVTAVDIKDGAKAAVDGGGLLLRSGWEDVLLAWESRKSGASTQNRQTSQADRVSILSVNWSGRFIRESLLHAAAGVFPASDARRPQLEQAIESMDIYANEVEGLDDPNGSSSLLNKNNEYGIRTSTDKLGYMRKITTPRKLGTISLDETKSLTLYVGDSSTDFECLLAADIGICMRDEPMGSGQKELAETLDRLGIRVEHLSKLTVIPDRSQEIRTLWWARDFEEIARLLDEETETA